MKQREVFCCAECPLLVSPTRQDAFQHAQSREISDACEKARQGEQEGGAWQALCVHRVEVFASICKRF